jgi:hypothetical protein
MSNRSGPFWDSVEGRTPLPPDAATLGFDANRELLATRSATTRFISFSG